MTVKELFEKLEDDNQHGLCALLTTIAAEDYRALLRVTDIIRVHFSVGSISHDLFVERTEIQTACIKKAAELGVEI
jgi:hypothetical protein